MTQVYVYANKVYFLSKAKDLCKLIQGYAEQYRTVQELIKAKLN
ncbi:hypothetical protein Desca_2079 [Desulfotomaculum nigrificans CO-1-SRB]|uniref:Uncharacterized protein n=1 Tax=Desulfotomaculum nigrificans (strain DSM 14880 / VKM B-2319 / CO-1-SRB) TaxID=868595 RepID=F6B9M2_DESCC|nr:hypothetical protein [Desulfotomaculum nigrificans]AEF94918.1 hypothetical protein Desca_2079 [Desulfotomaculum nigrificans CO-1-SRB]